MVRPNAVRTTDPDAVRTTAEPPLAAAGDARPQWSPVEVVRGTPGPEQQAEWDSLAVRSGAPPWVRPGWVVPWWTAFGTGTPLTVLLRSDVGELRAVLPLQDDRGRWRSPTNWHTPAYAVVAADDLARREVLHAALERSGGRLLLGFVDQELAQELAGAAAGGRGRSTRRVVERSPFVDLSDGWEDRLDPHVVRETRRRARRLEERGRVQLDLRDGSDGLEGLLAEGFAVEASGWKGRQGTAVSSSPATAAFYTEVAAWAAALGLLRLAFLRLDGRAIAFDLGLEVDGTAYLLKTGYDETERGAGPGKLLRIEVLRDCARRGVSTYELLGDAVPWKSEWTSSSRERLEAQAFPSGVGGIAPWVVHHRLLPVARVVRDRLHALRAR